MDRSTSVVRSGRDCPSSPFPDDPGGAGLTTAEARRRFAHYGPNALPGVPTPSLMRVFLRQFRSPLIYILLAAALTAAALGDLSDAGFIAVVLLANGLIGTLQEHSANQASAALRRLEEPRAVVIRDDLRQEIAARDLVPGDVVLVEAGSRVPADLSLTRATDLQCDQSLLTGESLPVRKRPPPDLRAEPAREDAARLFAGTLVTRGRARGTVIATGVATELGAIADQLRGKTVTRPPLVIRMERFSGRIALAVVGAVALLALAGALRGMAPGQLFMMAVGLAVSAIPEGLPVAISVTLAIGMRRMARAHVIVRRMPAVEALGSCTVIATDKTGTLTRNELVVTTLALADGATLACDGDPPSAAAQPDRASIEALLEAAVLPNEARLVAVHGKWQGSGDGVDVALLRLARALGGADDSLSQAYPRVARVPYEPERAYAASFHEHHGGIHVFVKGAAETLLGMCSHSLGRQGVGALDRDALLRMKNELAAQGLRVLAFARGTIARRSDGRYDDASLSGLTFLGFAGMKDPLRVEVPAAIRQCYQAGIEVCVLTGDDPVTATAIARQAGMVFTPQQVVTGDLVRQAEAGGLDELDRLVRVARVYARVKPAQKLAIVLALGRLGHFVAVTGDGVNDAPALKHAHVGVAMGGKGTELAKENADIILTDDNFASIVRGIQEGRIAYGNIRKVVIMLVSTGAAEVALFLLAIPLGLPMPLLPTQLLWLNLVTNGIQDVALAAERGDGDELSRPPRKPAEPIFDRALMRKVWCAVAVMGGGGFVTFHWLLAQGYTEQHARNLLLLLFVLFENFQVLNSRSERGSLFRPGFWSNPLLLTGIAAAQGLHIAAMYMPGLSGILQVGPVSWAEWMVLLALASVAVWAAELEKWWARRPRTG
ncbi:cation-translocating P-type ATPase [Achromobacter xylosoxidans]|uniref:cation-translocating P-type ATPase n=1 Tax=Alcaligenes xylosoxydans xylosoxydans TaxID=85698 RepID=UPI003EE40CAF